MVQTSFMGNALEHGFEIDEWPEETRKKWWNGEMSRIDKDLQSIDETSPRSKDLISYKEHLTDLFSGDFTSIEDYIKEESNKITLKPLYSLGYLQKKTDFGNK